MAGLIGVGVGKGQQSYVYHGVRSLDFRLKTKNLFWRQSQVAQDGLIYCVAEDGFDFFYHFISQVLGLRVCSTMPSFRKSTLGYNWEDGCGIEQTELKASDSLR